MSDDAPQVHIVMAADYVLDVYTSSELAWAHARTITGATVIHCYVHDKLPKSVVDDLTVELEYDDLDNLTPVEAIFPPLPEKL